MLVILQERVVSSTRIDSIVSAEFPDPVLQPALHAAVQEFMVHGPCDVRPHLSCRRQKADGSCGRNYPKVFHPTTRVLPDGFPEYRRRGRFHGQDGDRMVSDEWVVPHNPYLLARYRCHINCEVAGHVRSCKYIYKYVARQHAQQFCFTLYRYCFKAPDTVTLELNEIQAYLSGRLLSCAEATFRMLELKLHQEWPPVERLDMHLPHHNIVVFNPMDDDNDILDQLPAASSKLMQWFVLNQQDAAARLYRYVDIPEHYIWNVQDRLWQPRSYRNIKIGRLPSVNGHNSELNALRMILNVVRGAQSFMDLMTVDNHTYSSFRDAATARGLLEDDGEAISIFHEMTRVGVSVATLRHQFCTILVHCAPVNPIELFNMFCCDLIYGDVDEDSCRECLKDLDRIMRVTFGKSLRDAEFQFDLGDISDDGDMLLPPIINVDANLPLLERLSSLLTAEQHNAASSVMESVTNQIGFNVFAVLCSAGTGKTLFANFVACSLRAQGRIVVCVAASALAASLLEGGHTAHHTLHIPIPANDATFCSFTASERQVMKSADLLIWDEASMISQHVADTVDRSLQDMLQDTRPFGGKTIMFTGDFKQLLPVLRGGKGDNITIQRCSWWPNVRILEFRLNFRAGQDVEFARMLESVGSGEMAEVAVPQQCQARDVADLVERVFGNDLLNADANSMVLSLTLDDAETINTYCIQKNAGVCREAHAADTFINCRHPDQYPPEIVAGIRMPGVPPSCLRMKLGGRYMIIKNMSKEIFNGVRCVLVAFAGTKCVFVRLISGPATGTTTIIPCCVFNISPDQSGLPFNIRRRQFPMIVAYAVTVHKAQGQTLVKVGLYITTDIFTHGQLYTALSRTRGWSNIVVLSTLINPERLSNCVCRHVLRM
jgi:hypothetical protein